MTERCEICGCRLHRRARTYALPTVEGRAHASSHHYVAERFFGRSKNRPNEQRERIFKESPWGYEGATGTFCYECHEELLHNPVLLPEDVERLAEIVRLRSFAEGSKPRHRQKLAGRILTLHEALALGLGALLERERGVQADQ